MLSPASRLLSGLLPETTPPILPYPASDHVATPSAFLGMFRLGSFSIFGLMPVSKVWAVIFFFTGLSYTILVPLLSYPGPSHTAQRTPWCRDWGHTVPLWELETSFLEVDTAPCQGARLCILSASFNVNHTFCPSTSNSAFAFYTLQFGRDSSK